MESNKPPPFDERRHSDPQGVIDDLVKQTTKQAVEINRLNKELEALKNPPKPKKGKKDAQGLQEDSQEPAEGA